MGINLNNLIELKSYIFRKSGGHPQGHEESGDAEMTQSKRKPFAYIKKCGETGNCHYWNAVIGDHFEGIMPKDKDRWKESCKRINAAFNARVDEEVRKAVEDFRERAAKLAENCLSKDGEAIGFAIRCLPTEPEKPEVTS